MSDPNPDAQLQRGLRLLPAWNDRGPDRDARLAAGLEVILSSAEAGSVEAANYLGTGDEPLEGRIRWATAAAVLGDDRAITSLLTDDEQEGAPGRAALAAARADEPWAAYALAQVYGMGMVYTETGINVATVEGAYGWLPPAADPDAEAARWRERAIEAGFAPAQFSLAQELADEHPARARALYAAAAATGEVDALRELGRMHEEGVAGPVDLDAGLLRAGRRAGRRSLCADQSGRALRPGLLHARGRRGVAPRFAQPLA